MSFPHGGVRIIFNWVKYLSQHQCDVTVCVMDGVLQCNWMQVPKNDNIHYVTDPRLAIYNAVVILTSPHDLKVLDFIDSPSQRVFLFIQMLEHYFRPQNKEWVRQCYEFYKLPFKKICISHWNIDYLIENFNQRREDIYYIRNGVDFDDFPLSKAHKTHFRKIILFESWGSNNFSKDPEGVQRETAKLLKREGFHIVCYGGHKPVRDNNLIDEYYQMPDASTLNMLYEKCSALIKVTHMDARACAPLEAMTKGTITIRGIDLGDDDLIDMKNCLRLPATNATNIFKAVCNLQRNNGKYSALSENCLKYARENCDWNIIIKDIIKILNYATS